MKTLLKDICTVIALAGFGGFIRTLVGKQHGEPYNIKIGVTEILIAIFAGLLVHWLCQEYVISDNLRTAAIALAGYSARGIMAILETAVIQRCKGLAKFFGKLGVIALLLIAVAGCQNLQHRKYYEPNDVTMTRIDGRAYGAVQEETVKDGIPDWSAGKALNVSAVK